MRVRRLSVSGSQRASLCVTPGRLLASSLGKVYFSALHSHDYAALEYKAKSAQAVADSKEALCAEEAEAPEWCFV